MERSYLITMCLLIIHQIDAAYWKEWEMFYLPGGIQLYLLFNIIVIPILLLGYRSIIKVNQTAIKYSYLCAGLGITTFTIHAVFFVFGFEQFKLPLSLFIMGLCLISSAWQIIETRKYRPEVELV
ncbi:MAG: hypothetical protein HRU38_21785 [Saccharospirillaceae bacterium]|nr:hypothetical protein [Pseudomonadales bacterium]NRB81262.1 hypothetical protein [Saccharospirillaceae bacterium]